MSTWFLDSELSTCFCYLYSVTLYFINCLVPRCSKPQAEHYNMTLIIRDDYKLNHNLTIICNQGYYPVGSTNITCSNDSSWIPALPDCLLGMYYCRVDACND